MIEFVPCDVLQDDIADEIEHIERLLQLKRKKIICISTQTDDEIEDHFYTILDGSDVKKEYQFDLYTHYYCLYSNINVILSVLDMEFYIFLNKKYEPELQNFF
jgi:hypothetical protein